MAKPGSLAEKLLVARLKLKDTEAFAELYDGYVDRMYRFIYFKVDTAETAQDLVSQTFLNVWQHALEGKLKATQSFQALLYTTARHVVIDHYRKHKPTAELTEAVQVVDESADPAAAVDAQLDRSAIEARLQNIKSEYQEVIVLHYLNDVSIKEIATIINKKPGTVRVTLHRALKALQSQS